jgi:hypothetical protein
MGRPLDVYAGCRMLDIGCWMLDAGYWILDKMRIITIITIITTTTSNYK